MTIDVPQNSIDLGRLNTTLDDTNFTQLIAPLPDAPFVVVKKSNGVVRSQQADPFGNRIGGDGGLAISGLGAGDAIEKLAIEDNAPVLAYAKQTPANSNTVQSSSITGGTVTQAPDSSIPLALAGTVGDARSHWRN
jgi:hypothetical protein